MPAPADRRAMAARVEPSPMTWRREYRDWQQRPMSGSVTFYPEARREVGEQVTPLASLTVPLVEGLAEAPLFAGDYTVAERLTDADGVEMPYAGSYSLTIE